MTITNVEREKLIEVALFLEEQGYVMNFDGTSINYTKGNITISVTYPPNFDNSSVDIRFNDINKVFNIGWIALVRSDLKGKRNRLENAKGLLEYIRDTYQEIMDYQFCNDSDKLIDEYCEKHEEELQKKYLIF